MCKVFWFWPLLLTLTIHAQTDSEWAPVKDLKHLWLTVDRQGENYVPYVIGEPLNYPVVGFLLDESLNNGLVLECCIQQGTSVFVNNRIVDRISKTGCKRYDLDSLIAKNQLPVFLSFFKENLNPSQISTTVLTRVQPVRDLQAQSIPSQQITTRSNDAFANFFVVAILMVFAYYAFLINRYPKGNRDFFNMAKAFSMTLKEEKVLAQRNMTTVATLFLVMYGSILALLIMLFWKIFDTVPDLFGFVGLSTFRACLVSWLILSFLAFCVVELKYLLIKILCSLLNVDKIAQIHFFDFMRMSLIFVGSTLVTASVLYLTNFHGEMLFTVILYVFLALLGVRIVILLFKLLGETSFRKVHLSSYLCTTEILPLLIGIRIFF